jgi:cell wall-associated NlpC family hydrolase
MSMGRRQTVNSIGMAALALAWLSPSVGLAGPMGRTPAPPYEVVSEIPPPSLAEQTRFVRAQPDPKANIETTLTELIQPWLGTPYQWGSSERQIGTDCSGFTKAVFEEGRFINELPRSSHEQQRMGRPVKFAQLAPGDLVFFDMDAGGARKHVGIYMGHGKFAHASRTRGVVYDTLRYFPGTYRGARRILASHVAARGSHP